MPVLGLCCDRTLTAGTKPLDRMESINVTYLDERDVERREDLLESLESILRESSGLIKILRIKP